MCHCGVTHVTQVVKCDTGCVIVTHVTLWHVWHRLSHVTQVVTYWCDVSSWDLTVWHIYDMLHNVRLWRDIWHLWVLQQRSHQLLLADVERLHPGGGYCWQKNRKRSTHRSFKKSYNKRKKSQKKGGATYRSWWELRHRRPPWQCSPQHLWK